MKRNIALLLLALVFLMPYTDVNARRKKRKKQYAISYLGGSVGGGYSQLMHDIPNTTIPGGGTGLLGFEYFIKYGKHFNFHLGLEGMYFNSLSRMNDFSIDSKFYYNDPLHNNLEIDYYMDFMDYREQHNNFIKHVEQTNNNWQTAMDKANQKIKELEAKLNKNNIFKNIIKLRIPLCSAKKSCFICRYMIY